MLNPNRLNNFKIYEKDFILPRDRSEVRRILEACGILLQDEEFERVWRRSLELYRVWASLPGLGAQGRAISSASTSPLCDAPTSTWKGAVTNLHSVRTALAEFDRAAAALCVEQQVRDGTGGAREALEMLGLSAAAKTASNNSSMRVAS